MKLKLSGILCAAAALVVSQALARPVTRTEVRAAACAFAARGKVLGARLGQTVEKIDELTTRSGAAYYAVKMSGGGTVVTTGDDELSPVVAFLPGGEDLATLDKTSPLWALLDRDMSARAGAVKAGYRSAKSRAAWSRLVSTGNRPTSRVVSFAADPVATVSGIDDLRVAPLVDVHWNQSRHGENAFTPNNYVCGCVATAMSQIMRYHCWPTNEVEQFERNCEVDDNPKVCTAMGGLYAWDLMPGTFMDTMTTEEKEAIGKLTYDCGVAVRMSWSKDGSGAVTADVAPALRKCFGYASARTAVDYDGLPMTDEYLGALVYSNLDVGAPVQFGISEQSEELGRLGGHSIVGDGYGFVDDVSYVHLNMGWGGTGDAWYHLPNIDGYQATQGGTTYSANTVETIIYNIFPEVNGYVLAGRAVDEEGEPLANATITISSYGTTITNLTTTAAGIWSVILEDGHAYDVSGVSEDGEMMGDLEPIELSAGNSWGNDVVLTNPTVRNGDRVYTTLDRAIRLAETGDVLEIVAPTYLRRAVTVEKSLKILATNETVVATPVRVAAGATISIAASNRVVMTNVSFTEMDRSKPLVRVGPGSTLAIGGYVDLKRIALADAKGLEVTDALVRAITVETPIAGKDAAFATYSCAKAKIEDSVNLLLNAADDELGGKAVFDGTIVWSLTEVPDDAAVVRMNVAGETTNYRSIGKLLKYAPATGGIGIAVIKNDTLDERISLKNRTITLVGEPDEPERFTGVVAGPAAGFVVEAGGELVIKNLAFRNYVGKSESFVTIDGGSVVLDDGAVLDNLSVKKDTYGFGLVNMTSGKFTMKSGSTISNCVSAGNGGAISAWGGTLNLRGGTIMGCHATKLGGGVYAYTKAGGAAVTIGGDMVIAGNTSGEKNVADDLYVDDKRFVVAANLANSARIGVRSAARTGNVEGGTIAKVQDAAVAEVAEGVFFSDVTANLVAVLSKSGDTLEWLYVEPSDESEDPSQADVRVISSDGSTMKYYDSVDLAFKHVSEGCTVELLTALVGLTNDVSVACRGVTLRPAADQMGEAALLRDVGSIKVLPGASLTVADVEIVDWWSALDFSEFADPNPFFFVEGGALTLTGKTTIECATCSASRAGAAIVVYDNGVFTMEGDVEISENWNLFDDANPANASAGGGILVDNATAYLRGGVVFDNVASTGGGVKLENGAIAYVSGDFSVIDNLTLEDLTCNLAASDNSKVCLDAPLTGSAKIGITPGFRADTNLVGYVENWKNTKVWNMTSLTNSAARFFSDADPKVRGVIVTNATSTARIVWATAIAEDGLYVSDHNGSGESYHLMGVIPEIGPDPEPKKATPLPIAFMQIEMNEDRSEVKLGFTNAVQWCNYAVFGTSSLAEGFGTMPVTNFQWKVTEPKVELTLPTNGNLFWKVTADEGEIKE